MCRIAGLGMWAEAQPQSEPARYAADVIASLRSASDARKVLVAAESRSDDPIASSLNAMTAYRSAISKLQGAGLSLVRLYMKSTSPNGRRIRNCDATGL